MAAEEPEIPAVRLVLAEGLEEALAELGAGLEEEGIPFRVDWLPPGFDVAEVAHDAALRSRLGVGLAGDASRAHLQMKNLPLEKPMLSCENPPWRMLGHDAARLVKGLPLMMPPKAKGEKS